MSCGGTTTEQIVGPDPVRCQLAVTGVPQTVPPDGSRVALSVAAARDCTWSVSTDAPWVQVTPTSGQGDGAVTAAVSANAQTQPRSAVIAVNEITVTLNQSGVPCVFELGTREIRAGVEGGRSSIHVSTTAACEWRASSSESWIRILTDRGTGSGTVEIEVSRNQGSERSAMLSIAGVNVAVTQQDSSDPPPPPPPPPTCTFAIDSDRASFPSAGGAGALRVVTEPGCPWTASSPVSWVALSRGAGSGPDTLQYQVSANTSTTADRSGSLLVAGRTHRVEQQACPLSVDPGSQSFSSAGGPGSVRIVTNAGCAWTAASSNDWISMGRSSGSGPDTLSYLVAVHTATTGGRSGSVTVSGRTHSVNQVAYTAEEIAREGVLSDVSGACPSLTFVVGGRVFLTDHRTRFDDCSKVRNGARVYVRGQLLADGRILAVQVDIDD
jgi:hypothetical protein